MGPNTTPAPQLVRRKPARRARPRWDDAAEAVLSGGRPFTRVLGGPGSGKTTLLAEVAAERILHGGADPENVLVLTHSRRAAVAMRARITALLTSTDAPAGSLPRTVREPLVRTVHSYAFAVLRSQATLNGEPSPRLLSGPEQDTMIRDLLAGDLDGGLDGDAGDWPSRLRAALPLPGFAAEVRDLLLRAAERGLGPEDLVKLGKRRKRDEWVAAGVFWRQYEEVTLLQGAGQSAAAQAAAPALDAAELVASALLAFATDERLLATERARVRHLFVDDAQHLDPLQYRLLVALGEGAEEFTLAGDPDQAVFSFRGADPSLLADADPAGEHTVVLGVSHRMRPEIQTAVQRLAARLPGSGAGRVLTRDDTDGPPGAVALHLHPSPAAEAAWVADQLRRAHLFDEVPWSDMAVLVRSANRSIPVLHRALAAAGVPVAIPDDELPLARQPSVRPLLELLRCAAEPSTVDASTAAMLLTSPLGGADPIALRRLRRGLRRLELAAGGDRPSDELLVEVLSTEDKLVALADSEAGPARRLVDLLRTAREAIADGAGVEMVLWRVWQASGLERRWVAQSARGGPLGAKADRDLDAVVALFHAAERYVDRLPGTSVAGFADYLAAQHIAGDSLAQSAPTGDAVALLTAHAAAGREWTVVAVPGVQEGSWPDLRLRGTLLGVEQLVDDLSGVDSGPLTAVSQTAPLLAEERRLLLVAASRARRRLLVSAVRGEEEQPSRFLDELAGAEAGDDLADRIAVARPGRALVLADLVGDLRRAACDGKADPARRRLAARQLARLADAGVPGAHPDEWYGLVDASSVEALRALDAPIAVSPSTVEVLAKCPLRWMIERHGGADPAELPSVTGMLVHALAQAAAEGADAEVLRVELDKAWAAVDAGAPWFSRREKQRIYAMLETFTSWLASSRGELSQVDIERDVSVELPTDPPVTLRGRVDRLERDADGRPVVVDIKSGKSPVTKKDAEAHPQLAVYQLAAAYGAFTSLGLDQQPGGARLLYVSKKDKKTGAAERVQPPLDADTGRMWLDVVRDAAASSAGPEYAARENSDCDRCPARTSCPLHPTGRQVPE